MGLPHRPATLRDAEPQSKAGGQRMRRNPETGRMEPWKPARVAEDDAAYEGAQARAMTLRERIIGRSGRPIDVADPLDARCLDAALQGSSLVNLEGIDMTRYPRVAGRGVS